MAETVRPAKARPDPTPMRMAFSVGGLAALSGLVTGIVAAPPSVPSVPTAAPAPAAITQQRPVMYVQLAPGQSPPPGAQVIDAKAPKPVTIVTRVPAPAQRTVIVRTTQSGTVLP